ncbi:MULTISPECIES: hypothetical protein [Pseudomonas]|uniref:Integrase n=2 Tax=Pseudomonas TaxID=286 RepID=A0A7W2QBG3_9PSED|nr:MULTISPECIES: hypothetical protein [Pseudomonas]MBA6100319.1 hypothetical protein [Pseudomonas juntendi]MBA6118287.1 hypothetical protein [Pseudomonas putida]
MNSRATPDLALPGVSKGPYASSWGLNCLLYKGASATRINKVPSLIASGTFGEHDSARISLAARFHDKLSGDLAGGQSPYTTRGRITHLRLFYAWGDENHLSFTLDNVLVHFRAWCDHLINQARVSTSRNSTTNSSIASNVAVCIQSALDLNYRLLNKSGLKKKRSAKVTTKSEKQNLAETFEFGSFLVDITNSLDLQRVLGRLPITVELRDGRQFIGWYGRHPDVPHSTAPSRIARREAALTDTSWKTRFPIYNLRMCAELMIFIAQTGMNLEQAYKLKTGKFSYKSEGSGYIVKRVFKGRSKGTVEFHIYSEYRTHFERYIAWRNRLFDNDPYEMLFPIRSPMWNGGPPAFRQLRNRCNDLGIRFVPPRELRNTRANWLLRRSKDPSLTAEMNQHTEATLLQDYIRPNHQIAAVEISQFIHSIDPALTPPGPGGCVSAVPAARQGLPSEAPHPDCSNPAGCLFCIHQRDVRSLDHLWSLATYRYLKSLEIASHKVETDNKSPPEAVISEISMRLNKYKETDEELASWLHEVELRISEEDYHPQWDGFIQLMEASHAKF